MTLSQEISNIVLQRAKRGLSYDLGYAAINIHEINLFKNYPFHLN